MSSEFGKSLLRAAKELDAPAAGAKARATTELARAVAAGTVATAAVSTGAGLKLAAVAASIVLAIGGTAVVMTRHARPAVAVSSAPTVDQAPEPPVIAPASPAPSHVASAAKAAGDPNACALHALPESVAKACSAGSGKTVFLSVTNQCLDDVDLFWVDYKCEEVFHSRVAPGHTFRRGTKSSHVWRIRDHATHALLKEFRPEAPADASDWDAKERAPVRALPEVVIANGPALDEVPPPFASGVGHRAKLTLKNERDESIVFFWIGGDFEEHYTDRLEPKHSYTLDVHDTDAIRIRSAKGELLMDLPPAEADATDAVKVP